MKTYVMTHLAVSHEELCNDPSVSHEELCNDPGKLLLFF